MSKLEKYVLASLLRIKDKQLAYALKADDFAEPVNAKVFKLMLERLDKEQTADMSLLSDPSLTNDEVIELSEAIDHTTDQSILEEKIDELTKESDLRFLLTKSEKLSGAIKSQRLTSVNVAVDFLTNLTDDLVMRHPKDLDISLGSSVRSALARIEQQKQEPRIRTGIKQIDNSLYGGIKLGEYVIFAARPNAGKSIFTILPAIEAAKSGMNVLVAVNEMDKEATSIRMMANIANVNINAIEGNIPFKAGEIDALSVASDQMKQMPMSFMEHAYKTDEIEKFLKTRQKLKKPISLVIVDMASRLSTEVSTKVEREQLNEVSKALFRMSKKYHCTVIGTVQISRAGVLSDEPQLEHLKETGKWEEDADKVFMMWADKEDPEKRHISLKKNRTGQKGFYYTVVLDGCHMKFKEDLC